MANHQFTPPAHRRTCQVCRRRRQCRRVVFVGASGYTYTPLTLCRHCGRPSSLPSRAVA